MRSRNTERCVSTCQYRYHKLLEQNWSGRSFEISPWSPRMGSRKSAASTSPRNVVNVVNIVENSPVASVGPWYIALKTCCSWNVKHYVKFSNQPISLNISHENWFRWRHKNPDQKDSFQKLATLEQFNLPLCPCISGRLTTKAPTVTVGRNQKPPPRSFGKVGKIQQMPWKMSTILPSISHFFQLFVGRIRFLVPDHPN